MFPDIIINKHRVFMNIMYALLHFPKCFYFCLNVIYDYPDGPKVAKTANTRILHCQLLVFVSENETFVIIVK